MRINSHASEQYRKNLSAEKPREKKNTEPQARVESTTFGFRLGKLGVEFSSQKTVLDPSLSRDVREKREQAQAFRAEAEVETLRAKVGAEGAAYRERDVAPNQSKKPSINHVKNAMTAYARSSQKILPPPGNMLAAVV